MSIPDYYAVLGVAVEASTDDIKLAYRQKIRQIHPDKNSGNEAQIWLVNAAYEALKDPKKRQDYDKNHLAMGYRVGRAVGKFGNNLGQNISHRLNPHQLKDSLKSNFIQLKHSFKPINPADFDDNVVVWVYPWQAVLGDRIQVMTDFHQIWVKVPRFEHQIIVKIIGAGKPINQGENIKDEIEAQFGDLYICFKIKIPSTHNDQQKQLWQQLKAMYE